MYFPESLGCEGSTWRTGKSELPSQNFFTYDLALSLKWLSRSHEEICNWVLFFDSVYVKGERKRTDDEDELHFTSEIH